MRYKADVGRDEDRFSLAIFIILWMRITGFWGKLATFRVLQLEASRNYELIPVPFSKGLVCKIAISTYL